MRSKMREIASILGYVIAFGVALTLALVALRFSTGCSGPPGSSGGPGEIFGGGSSGTVGATSSGGWDPTFGGFVEGPIEAGKGVLTIYTDAPSFKVSFGVDRDQLPSVQMDRPAGEVTLEPGTYYVWIHPPRDFLPSRHYLDKRSIKIREGLRTYLFGRNRSNPILFPVDVGYSTIGSASTCWKDDPTGEIMPTRLDIFSYSEEIDDCGIAKVIFLGYYPTSLITVNGFNLCHNSIMVWENCTTI